MSIEKFERQMQHNGTITEKILKSLNKKVDGIYGTPLTIGDTLLFVFIHTDNVVEMKTLSSANLSRFLNEHKFDRDGSVNIPIFRKVEEVAS